MHSSQHRRARKARALGGLAALALAGLALCGAPSSAEAFCGFYVAGADAKLYNNATMVVMMRESTRTVLAMQNNYQGPPENFAMVVPVPFVLGEDDVKTLEREVFDRVDQLAAPRLVEYWERDPCDKPLDPVRRALETGDVLFAAAPTAEESAAEYGVTIEAEFTVAEYEIVILGAEDSTGLDAWLHDNGYSIPEGAGPVLEPYVQSGMKFFVAKVDVSKVALDDQGQAQLSPLRVHYDTAEFSLPVRLGLINSNGDQDLIIHILGKQTRFEVANYENVTIPTNLEVNLEVRDRFSQFYAALYDHTLAAHPQAIVTEYAWAASSCDPCPVPPLSAQELRTLGADVLPFDRRGEPSEFTLTRLHMRYDESSLGEDLVFQEADPIVRRRLDQVSRLSRANGAMRPRRRRARGADQRPRAPRGAQQQAQPGPGHAPNSDRRGHRARPGPRSKRPRVQPPPAGLIEGAPNEAKAREYGRLEGLLFPIGLRVVKLPYIEEGGVAVEFERTVSPKVREQLASIVVGAQTLDDLFVAWITAGNELGKVVDQRAKLKASLAREGSAVGEIDTRAGRSKWVEAVRGLL